MYFASFFKPINKPSSYYKSFKKMQHGSHHPRMNHRVSMELLGKLPCHLLYYLIGFATLPICLLCVRQTFVVRSYCLAISHQVSIKITKGFIWLIAKMIRCGITSYDTCADIVDWVVAGELKGGRICANY